MTAKYSQAYPFAKRDLLEAKKTHRKKGRTYYFATRFFPKEIRDATSILYTWMRTPDDWVDSRELSLDEKRLLLNDWAENWLIARKTGKATIPNQKLALLVFKKYDIPKEWDVSFLKAMDKDLYKDRYANYEELREYMYGSAAVVGLIMTKIIGYQENALPYAESNGYAMQLTNFLRDIGEDWKDRGRIYLPKDEMQKFGVNEEMISKGTVTQEFKGLMKKMITTARDLYSEAKPGIRLLKPRGIVPVMIASELYEKILDKIEDNMYDVFTKRSHTNLREKITTGVKIFIHG